ncbi:MAG: hypothetical protein Kow0090_03800 [Myxococcota bacterium]
MKNKKSLPLKNANLNGVYEVNSQYPKRMVKGEILLVNPDSREVLHFNEVASWYLNQFDGKTSLAEILEQALDRYDVDSETAEKDLLKMLDILIKDRVLKPAD